MSSSSSAGAGVAAGGAPPNSNNSGAAAGGGGAAVLAGGGGDSSSSSSQQQQLLTQTLLAACRADPAAERQLEQWSQANLGDVALALAIEIGAPHRQPEVRQVAAVYLKNILSAQTLQFVLEKHQRWSQLDATKRQQIKTALLSSLTSSEPDAPRNAARAAAEIAAVELPYGQWNEFVPFLMDVVTSTNSNSIVQLAALECLGYAAEKMAELEGMLSDVPPLSENVVDKMLTSIVHGMQTTQSDPVKLAAITALRNSLGFVRKNMAVKGERDFMIQAICESTQCATNARVRQLAYECMDMLADLYYEFLGDYMTVFFRLTTTAIRGASAGASATSNEFVEDDDAVKMAAIEFWSTIAYTELGLLEEERDKLESGEALDGPPCPKYSASALETLVPLLLETLTKQEEDVESDAWNLQAAGAVCLESLSCTVEALMVPHVIPFVQANIGHPDWRMRDAAIVAFAATMEGPETAVLAEVVMQAIPVLLNSFQDRVAVVRDSSVHCIGKICRLHVAAVSHESLQHILQALMGKLQEPATIAAHAGSAIFNVAQSVRQAADENGGGGTAAETNVLSALMFPLLQALLAATDRPDATEANLRLAAMSAAAELVSSAAMDSIPIFREFLPAVVARMESALQIPVVNKEDSENKDILLGMLCALITVLFQRLDKGDVLPHVDRCMTSLLQTLHMRLCAEEALLSVGAVAGTMEGDFTKYLSSFITFLNQGLNDFEAQSLCTVAVGVLVDVCTAVGPAIQPYCDEIMTSLRNVLQDSSVTRDIKPVVISAFGDVAMAIGAAYEPYLQVSVMMLMQAAQQSAPPDDEDLMAFINSLRLSILEAYSGIVLGLSDGNVLHLLLPSISEVLAFLDFLSKPESRRDEDVLHKAVTLLGDIAQHMGSNAVVRQQMTQPYVAQLISDAMEDPGLRDTAAWTQRIVVSSVQQAA